MIKKDKIVLSLSQALLIRLEWIDNRLTIFRDSKFSYHSIHVNLAMLYIYNYIYKKRSKAKLTVGGEDSFEPILKPCLAIFLHAWFRNKNYRQSVFFKLA